MGMIVSNGVQLNVQQLGDGPMVVMCHGLVFGSIATWYFTAAGLLASRFKVVLYDMRGHGKSELSVAGYDVDTLSDDLGGLVDHLQALQTVGKIRLVGHSYGALVALNFALRYPDRVERLVLIDAPLPANHYIYPSLSSAERGFISQLHSTDTHHVVSSPSRGGSRIQKRLDFLLFESTLRNDVRNSGDIDDERLKSLNMPVLCIYGSQSDCLDSGRRLSQVIPNAQLKFVKCGHFVPVDAPKEMTSLIDGFL
jgi:pimeloyl-ACP methyl ester carboxylesterase